MEFDIFKRKFFFLANEEQINKLKNFISQHFQINMITIILISIVLLYIILRIVANTRKKEKLHLFLKSISWLIWLVLIIKFALLTSVEIRGFRFWFTEWYSGADSFHESNIINSLINICVYIPYGYLIYKFLTKKQKFLGALLVVFVTSLGMELLQYVFEKGLTSLQCIIENTIGGLIGILFAILIYKK